MELLTNIGDILLGLSDQINNLLKISVDDVLPIESSTSSPDAATRSTALETFTCFNNLPPELRRRIWITAAHISRFLTICDGPEGWRTDPETGSSVTFRMTMSQQPAVLQVCRESRAECLKFFVFIFPPWTFGEPHRDAPDFEFLTRMLATPTIYYNPLCDVVFLSRYCNVMHFAELDDAEWALDMHSIAIDIQEIIESNKDDDSNENDDSDEDDESPPAKWKLFVRRLLKYGSIRRLFVVVSTSYINLQFRLRGHERLPSREDFETAQIEKGVAEIRDVLNGYANDVKFIMEVRYLYKPHPDLTWRGCETSWFDEYIDIVYELQEAGTLEKIKFPDREAVEEFSTKSNIQLPQITVLLLREDIPRCGMLNHDMAILLRVNDDGKVTGIEPDT